MLHRSRVLGRWIIQDRVSEDDSLSPCSLKVRTNDRDKFSLAPAGEIV